MGRTRAEPASTQPPTSTTKSCNWLPSRTETIRDRQRTGIDHRKCKMIALRGLVLFHPCSTLKIGKSTKDWTTVVGKSHIVQNETAGDLPGLCWGASTGGICCTLDSVRSFFLQNAACSVSVTRLPDGSLGACLYFFLSCCLCSYQLLSELARRLIPCLVLAIFRKQCTFRWANKKLHTKRVSPRIILETNRPSRSDKPPIPCCSHVTEVSSVCVYVRQLASVFSPFFSSFFCSLQFPF